MKKAITLITIILLNFGLFAQITITRDDMPDVGDTIRLSSAVILPGIDPSLSGPDYSWDFSMLEPQSQTVEGYVSPTTTPFLYQIIFNQAVANLASPIEGLNFLPNFDITSAYVFYKESDNNYVRAGYAATIAGVPVPMKYDQAELLYTFPLQATSPADSSYSTYSLEFPGVGYFSIERKRVNVVDGWGTLTTPFGTFNTLRVQSNVYEYDSLYIDSVQVGVPVNRYYTEYKWLANGHSVPVLTITQEGPLVTAQYVDTIHNLTPMSVNLGPDQTVCKGTTVTIMPEIAGGTPPYRYQWSNGDTTALLKIKPEQTTTYSVVITDQMNNMAFGSVTVYVIDFVDISLGADTLLCAGFSITFDAGPEPEEYHWFVNGTELSQNQTFTIDSTGIGLNNAVVRIEYIDNECSGDDEAVVNFYICGGIPEHETIPLKISPNPVNDFLTIEQDNFSADAQVFIGSPSGKIIKPMVTSDHSGKIKINTSGLKAGNYIIVISDKNYKGVAKFIKK